MSLIEKVIQVYLTFILSWLSFFKILLIVPFISQIKIESRILVKLIDLVYKPAYLPGEILVYFTERSGMLIVITGFLAAISYFILIIIESYFLAKLIIILAKSVLPKNIFSNIMASVKNKMNVNEIESSGKFVNVKEYLPIAVFIILLIILYPILTNFVKKNSRENNNNRNEATLLKQTDEIKENVDSDNDGLDDRIEFVLGTDRYFADTDQDGFSDYDELKNGYNPLIISPDDKLDENTYDLVKKILFSDKIAEFPDLNSLRLKLENQISNKLCENSSYLDNDLNTEEKIKKAVTEGNPCFCSRISDREQKNACYGKLAISTNNVILCNYILEGAPNAEKDKANCFHALALINLDEEYCYRIREGKNQNGCIVTLSIKTKKRNLCGRVKNLDERDDCYYGVAIFLGDINLCDKIRPSEESGNNDREFCKKMIKGNSY